MEIHGWQETLRKLPVLGEHDRVNAVSMLHGLVSTFGLVSALILIGADLKPQPQCLVAADSTLCEPVFVPEALMSVPRITAFLLFGIGK